MVFGGLLPANLLRERNPTQPADSGYYEEFVETVANLPILFDGHIAVRDESCAVHLESGDATWADQFAFDISRDGRPADDCRMELVVESARIEVSGEPNVERSVARATLRPGQTLKWVWQLRIAGGAVPPPGLYEISVRAKPGAETLFGCTFVVKEDFRILLRAMHPGDELRLKENMIEFHYRTGGQLRVWNTGAGDAHLEKAKDLVERLLRSGAGDEEGLYNVTPRYQAVCIYQALGMNEEATAMLTHVLQGICRQSKMRYAHFGTERGLLPRTRADHLIAHLNRLRTAEAVRRGEKQVQDR